MAGVTFLSDLKLRGSYGITGQQDVSGTTRIPTFRRTRKVRQLLNTSLAPHLSYLSPSTL